MQYNPLLPNVQANPFPFYADLRRNDPVAWLEPLQCFALSRYGDVDFALRNPQVFSSAKWITQSLGALNPAPEVPWMIESDPPDHTRLRKLVNKGFTPRMVGRLEPQIRAITRALLEDVRAGREFDFVQDFSGRLPVIVIAEMLGIDVEHRADFRRWSDNVVLASSRPGDPATCEAIRRSNAEMRDYLREVIALRRKQPKEDLISAMVQAEEERQALTSDEILAMAVLILIAGNETTMNLLSSVVMTLLANPEAAARVRADRASIPKLIEETLRYESPVQIVFRRTTQPIELSGKTIPADAAVYLLIGSANRDGEKFNDPDRFDIDRDAGEHLAFGFATHFCLGAQLARLEAKVALEGLFAHPPYEVDPSRVERVSSVLLRGFKRLPMRFAELH
ncbi:MAG TPA: cytochrome P450 [Candidatus Binataceae bacterium]|nr:cytochrome P450 [Candidatus Binataceae bacterium]